MNVDELYQLIENTSLLNRETLPKLKQLIKDYPYFHAARLLYLKNLAVLNDIHFSSELKKMAIYIPDRKKLFKLIEGTTYALDNETEELLAQKTDDTFSLIDSFLSSHNQSGEMDADPTILFRPTASSDYLYWAISNEPHKNTDQKDSSPKLQHQDLIDSFLEEDEKRVPGTGLNLDDEDDAFGDYDYFPEETGKVDDQKIVDDSFFTETLAQIYIKQKRYDKALQIIKKLSLNYPEKNVYFADQIRFLEKLIINTKK